MHTDEIAVINDRHARHVELAFMQQFGTCSRLLDYTDRILRLEIYVLAGWKLSPADTARFYALLFRDNHPELEEATGYDARVIFDTQPGNPTGVTREQQVQKFRYYNRDHADIAGMTDEQILVMIAMSRKMMPDEVKEKLWGERLTGMIDN